MPKVYKHPISGYLYSLNDSGLVEVVDPATDRRGVFDDKGTWFEGELRDVDFQILGWVGRHPEARRLRDSEA